MNESRIPRPLEHLFVWSVFVLAALLTWRLATVIESGAQLWLALAFLGLGYVAADFVSGLIHWAFDRLGSEHTPVLGHAFIHPFRYHHIDPKDMMRGDFVSTNGKNSVGCIPILLLALAIPAPAGAATSVAGIALALSFTLSIWMTNQFHKWAHLDRPGAFIGVLQRLHLVLPPGHHALHHRIPFQANYCITSGWCNPLLERVRFFHHLERVLSAAGVRFTVDPAIAFHESSGAAPGDAVVGSPHGSIQQRG